MRVELAGDRNVDYANMDLAVGTGSAGEPGSTDELELEAYFETNAGVRGNHAVMLPLMAIAHQNATDVGRTCRKYLGSVNADYFLPVAVAEVLYCCKDMPAKPLSTQRCDICCRPLLEVG